MSSVVHSEFNVEPTVTFTNLFGSPRITTDKVRSRRAAQRSSKSFCPSACRHGSAGSSSPWKPIFLPSNVTGLRSSSSRAISSGYRPGGRAGG